MTKVRSVRFRGSALALSEVSFRLISESLAVPDSNSVSRYSILRGAVIRQRIT